VGLGTGVDVTSRGGGVDEGLGTCPIDSNERDKEQTTSDKRRTLRITVEINSCLNCWTEYWKELSAEPYPFIKPSEAYDPQWGQVMTEIGRHLIYYVNTKDRRRPTAESAACPRIRRDRRFRRFPRLRPYSPRPSLPPLPYG